MLFRSSLLEPERRRKGIQHSTTTLQPARKLRRAGRAYRVNSASLQTHSRFPDWPSPRRKTRRSLSDDHQRRRCTNTGLTPTLGSSSSPLQQPFVTIPSPAIPHKPTRISSVGWHIPVLQYMHGGKIRWWRSDHDVAGFHARAFALGQQNTRTPFFWRQKVGRRCDDCPIGMVSTHRTQRLRGQGNGGEVPR